MLDKLEEIENQFVALEKKISDPEIITNIPVYQEHVKKHAELKDVVEIIRELKKTNQEITDLQEMLKDPEYKEFAKEELETTQKKQSRLENDIQTFLIPKDKNDKKNALIEIRSGTGGDEAALFAADLYRMYTKFADSKGWATEVLSENITEMGGVKEIIFVISGTNVYAQLKFEMGTHRVQRVPDTETQGRVHTSAATVAILPEAEEVDITIDTKDLRVDTYRASGSGGQHVNKTSSAVRITHLPTNVVVSCQDERSQFQNKERCMRMLRTKLYETEVEKKRKTEADLRKSQVGSGDRSQKIRTYNFPQKRITDHRINVSIFYLEEFLNGKISELIEKLQTVERLEKIKLTSESI
ncbi:peptide chain release factor 1 [bacterium]|mgnify:FL=1|jgi:peptide chain release factor 1|nr:peptide chain release factor 1 [bacterium]